MQFLHSSFAGFLWPSSWLRDTPKHTFFLYPQHCISFIREDVGRFKRWLFVGFEWIAAIKNATYLACSQSEQRQISARIPFRKCILVENAVAEPSTFRDLFVGKITPAGILSVVTVGQVRAQKGPMNLRISLAG